MKRAALTVTSKQIGLCQVYIVVYRPNVCVCSGNCMQEFDAAFHHNMVKRKKCLHGRSGGIGETRRPLCKRRLRQGDSASVPASLDFKSTFANFSTSYIDYTTDDWLDKLLIMSATAPNVPGRAERREPRPTWKSSGRPRIAIGSINQPRLNCEEGPAWLTDAATCNQS